MPLLTKIQAFLAKEEPTEGEDANPTAASDAIAPDAPIQVTPQPNIADSDEITGSVDAGEPDVGTIPMQITAPVALKGSGTAGTAPESGLLLRGCGFSETVQATQVPAASDAVASDGSATSVSVDTADGANTQNAELPTTEGALAGMPVTVDGTLTIITKYSVSGNIVTMDLADTFDTPPSAGSTVRVEPGVVYAPASASVPTLTEYLYLDGKLKKVFGCRGGVNLSAVNGQKARLDFTFQGLFGSETDAAVPTTTVQASRPPVWKGGVMSIDRKTVGVNTFSLTPNNTLSLPDNPNSAEGFDPPIITARNIQGNVDPIERLVATADVMKDFRDGTARLVHVRSGLVAGNRWAATVARAKLRDNAPGDRGGIATAGLPFSALGADDETFITFF